ncbi:hypothetical protein [Nocardia sp. IFM 10818]
MIRWHKCLSLACDECDSEFDQDDSTIHFPDLTAARKSAERDGWTMTDSRILCQRCASRAACALIGHVWDDWVDWDLEQYQGRRRSCEACGLGEYDPPMVRLGDLPPLNTVQPDSADSVDPLTDGDPRRSK